MRGSGDQRPSPPDPVTGNLSPVTFPIRLGVDAGGTFTDVCIVDNHGRIHVHKLPSTPRDPSQAIVDGAAAALAETGLEPGDVGYFGHGTTVATNTLLQGTGARTGVITTGGFRDLLELGRQQRSDLYDLQVDKPPALARRRDRLEVPERMRYDGVVEKPLDEEAVREAVRELRDRGIQAVAVCFLYSYLYPQHEERVGEILREEFPEAYSCLSHRVLAEFREYERLSSTVVNAFVGPVMSGYIAGLRERLREIGVPADPYITQSNGGLISLDAARELPVRTILSGPAAGVIGAAAVASVAAIEHAISFDMGGTSTDVSLIEAGRARMGHDMSVAGYPLRAPMIDINTVGAGGGSIAWVDSGGHLKVGPRSAGANPGPAGYGLGGMDPTVTDANLALGILNRQQLLGGRMPVDAGAADAAVDQLGERLGLDRVEVAGGILSIVTMNMARAIRVISIERGYDPRDFTLVAFGGAGPLHAARLARELEIPRILVPAVPGILCALGLLVSDLRADFSRTLVVAATEAAIADVNGVLGGLEREARHWLEREMIAPGQRRIRRIADMRYAGQNYELGIELPPGDLDGASLENVLRDFHAEHDRAYGFAASGEPVQVVTLRLEAFGEVPRPAFPELEPGHGEPEPVGRREVFLNEAGGWIDCPVYDRLEFLAGQRFAGPAIIEQMDSTTLALPGQEVGVDARGNLLIQERGR